MNAVGIDVSKGKSMVSVIRPFGKLVVKPYEVRHTSSELGKLAKQLQSLTQHLLPSGQHLAASFWCCAFSSTCFFS